MGILKVSDGKPIAILVYVRLKAIVDMGLFAQHDGFVDAKCFGDFTLVIVGVSEVSFDFLGSRRRPADIFADYRINAEADLCLGGWHCEDERCVGGC